MKDSDIRADLLRRGYIRPANPPALIKRRAITPFLVEEELMMQAISPFPEVKSEPRFPGDLDFQGESERPSVGKPLASEGEESDTSPPWS